MADLGFQLSLSVNNQALIYDDKLFCCVLLLMFKQVTAMFKNLAFFLTLSCSFQERVIPPVRILKHWSTYKCNMVDLATLMLTDEMECDFTECALDTSSNFNVYREIFECILDTSPAMFSKVLSLEASE